MTRDKSRTQISRADHQRFGVCALGKYICISNYSDVDDSLMDILLLTAARCTRQSFGGRRCLDENVQKKAQTQTVLSVQRYIGLWEHRD